MEPRQWLSLGMIGAILPFTCVAVMVILVSNCLIQPTRLYTDPVKDVLKYLLPSLPVSLLSQTNENDSPPLHWAILNNHVAIVQLLVDIPEEQGGGLPLLKVRLDFPCLLVKLTGIAKEPSWTRSV